MVYSYHTLNTNTYNVSIDIYHCILNIPIQIIYYMFQNGNSSLLLWHNIQTHVQISIALMAPFCMKITNIKRNSTKMYTPFSIQLSGGGPPDRSSITIVYILLYNINNQNSEIQSCSRSFYIYVNISDIGNPSCPVSLPFPSPGFLFLLGFVLF